MFLHEFLIILVILSATHNFQNYDYKSKIILY